jgi:hypothetical protein
VDIKEASRNFILDFHHKKTAKNCETIKSHSENKFVWIFRTITKNIHFVTVPLLKEKGRKNGKWLQVYKENL